jgi:hypothetical protein
LRNSPFPEVTASEYVRLKNGKVRAALAQHGDDGSVPRHLMHFLFRCDDATKTEAEMASMLIPLGFEVDLSKCEGGIIAEEHREVASEDFDCLTQSLSNLAEAHGWTYDGFECAVEALQPPPVPAGAWGGLIKLFGG